MRIRKLLANSLLLILATTQLPAVHAQQKSNVLPAASQLTGQQDETVRIGTAVVQTEAIVTDKSGRRINGLKSSDFAVLDDGKPQAVDYFAAIEGSTMRETNFPSSNGAASGSNRADAGVSTAPVSPLIVPYRGRYIALVFDDLNLTSDNFTRARRSFADYINTKLTATDMVALISTGGALASLQQFTTDKQMLLSGLNRIAPRNSNATSKGRPWNMTDDEAIRIDKGDSTALSRVKSRAQAEGSDSGPTGTIASETAGPGGGEGPKFSPTTNDERNGTDGRIRNFATAIVSEITQNARNKIETLKGIFKGMSDLPGRKIVVLMTEAFGTAAGTSEDLNKELTNLIEIARRGGISVYALDAAGLTSGNVTASEHMTGLDMAVRNANPSLSLSNFEQLGAARKLVAGTGGELIANTNSLVAGLDRAIEDSNTYYVVGFKPALLDNKFHRLIISIKDKSDLIVRTRLGYLASNPETIRGTNAELVEALRSPVPRLDLPVDLVANVVPTSPTAPEQIVVTGLHVGRNYLTLPPATAADQTVSYEVVSYVFGGGIDKPVGGVVKTVTYDLAKDTAARPKLKAEGFVLVPQPFAGLAPGLYQMRAVIREKLTGAVGLAYQFFEVPDLKDRKFPSLSGIVLTNAGQSAFTGSNSFKPGVDVDGRFIIYNLPKVITGLTQSVKLLDGGGKVLFDSELPIAAPTAIDRVQAPQGTRFNLPTTRGRYALVVTLKDTKGKVDIERRADLVVE